MTGQKGVHHTEWRQGDFALACGSLLFGDTPEAPEDGPMSPALENNDPAGFVVVSQTCDIVREVGYVPYVAVCPLLEVSPETLRSIEAGRQPRFALVEHAPENHVVDLLRIMSVSKGLLSTWVRQIGFSTDRHAIRFARDMERVFGRFAFPEKFNECINPLTKQIFSKHSKNGDLGKALRSLSELRVFHSSSWEAEFIEIAFLLIAAEEDQRIVTMKEIKETFEAALLTLTWAPPFSLADPPVHIGTYDDFSARAYVDSVSLDVNSLSFSTRVLAALPSADSQDPFR